MTNLKTLKDLSGKCMLREDKCCVPDYVEELKAEAMKWMKELRFRRNYLERPLEEYLEKSLLETERWIKYFFNITEEDLK